MDDTAHSWVKKVKITLFSIWFNCNDFFFCLSNFKYKLKNVSEKLQNVNDFQNI